MDSQAPLHGYPGGSPALRQQAGPAPHRCVDGGGPGHASSERRGGSHRKPWQKTTTAPKQGLLESTRGNREGLGKAGTPPPSELGLKF